MTYLDFFREGVKNLKTVGTFTRSSRFLCKGAIKHINFEEADMIVELGAGDGVITEHILESMHKEAQLLAFEVNRKFCDTLRSIDDHRLVVAEDSAEQIGKYLLDLGKKNTDYIVSAIPFVALPKELGMDIINQCFHSLRKGGLFIQVHYSLLVKDLYESVFGNVDVNFVPLNVPPAFVLVCEKN